MQQQRYVDIYGDSILKGVQLDDEEGRYRVINDIDVSMLESNFSLKISNYSKFGCTITKALTLIEKRFENLKLPNGKANKSKPTCDAIVLNLGGNDCDFNWKAIAENPDLDHQPNTPLDVFVETYRKIIELLNEKGIRPIITTLPPLDAQRFFNWFCGNKEEKATVLKWLGGVESIYRWQENYSRTIEQIAEETGTLLIDLRGAFLKHRKIEPLLCTDGTHPNTKGQKVITQGIFDFIIKARDKGKINLFA